jgi:hypothetical protein
MQPAEAGRASTTASSLLLCIRDLVSTVLQTTNPPFVYSRVCYDALRLFPEKQTTGKRTHTEMKKKNGRKKFKTREGKGKGKRKQNKKENKSFISP